MPRPFTRLLLVAALAALLAAPLHALAQREREHGGMRGAQREGFAPQRRMSPEERQQLRRELREQRGQRREDGGPSRLSPEERERMRREMIEAHRRMRRE